MRLGISETVWGVFMENESYFPLFVSLKGKRVLLVGAGNIAARRARVLLSFGAKLYIVAPECSNEMEELLERETASHRMMSLPETPEMEELCKKGSDENLIYRKRCFEERDLKQMDIVIAATDNVALNHEIVKLCKQKGILSNNASSQEDCDFFFPAILHEDGLTIGVSSNGNDHKKVAAVCKKLRRFFTLAVENNDRSV